MLIIRAGINKILVRIENREDPNKTASGLGLQSLSKPFWQVMSVGNLRRSTLRVFPGKSWQYIQDFS